MKNDFYDYLSKLTRAIEKRYNSFVISEISGDIGMEVTGTHRAFQFSQIWFTPDWHKPSKRISLVLMSESGEFKVVKINFPQGLTMNLKKDTVAYMNSIITHCEKNNWKIVDKSKTSVKLTSI